MTSLMKSKVDITSREVAFPAYLLLSITQFELKINCIFGSGADGQVVIATVIDETLAKDLRARH